MLGGVLFGWTAAGLFFLLLLAVALSDISLTGHVSRKGRDDYMQLDVTVLWGIIRYRLVIPFARFQGTSVKLQSERSGNTLGEKLASSAAESVDAQAAKKLFEKTRDMLRFTRDLSDVVKRMLCSIRMKEWRWTTTVGTGDAVSTAMTTGLAWSVKTSVLGVLSQLVRLQASPQLEVIPLFNATAFSTELHYRARIRVSAVAAMGIRLLIHAGKEKGGVTGWFRLLKDMQPRSA